MADKILIFFFFPNFFDLLIYLWIDELCHELSNWQIVVCACVRLIFFFLKLRSVPRNVMLDNISSRNQHKQTNKALLHFTCFINLKFINNGQVHF